MVLRSKLISLSLGTIFLTGCASAPPDPAVPGDGPKPAPAVPSAESLPPAQTRSLHIDLTNEDFQYFEDGEPVLAGPVSSGTVEHPTPSGRFRVLSKEKDKVSHSYTNAFDMPTPMPYSMQFDGPYFIHEGWVPGYPDSHGCVRLKYEDARFLFKRMRRGDEVVISDAGSGGSWRQEEPGQDWLRYQLGNWLAPDDPRRSW
jgi:lipoprotein-anchoring transpeptidase ErfK/SrfK